MQTHPNVANERPSQDRDTMSATTSERVARLATFLAHLNYANGQDRAQGDGSFIDVKHTDAEVARYLVMSMPALEQGYAELTRQGVVRRHGPYRIEILNRSRLSELARYVRYSGATDV